MKINISLDLDNFYSEFQGLSEWANKEAQRQIKAALRKDPRWKKFIKEQTDRAIESAIMSERKNDDN